MQSAFSDVGVACGGRGEKGAATDPINHNIFVATPQYPVNASSASTGQAGLLVFHDSAPTSTPPARSQATLGTNGTATITMDGRTMRVFANLSGLTDAPTHLVVTTTAGNEVAPCNEAGGAAICSGVLYGDPHYCQRGLPFTSSGGRTEFIWKCDIWFGCKALRLKAEHQSRTCILGRWA